MNRLCHHSATTSRTFHYGTTVALIAVLTLILSPGQVLAQGLVILDCQGITRAVHETRTAELNRVEVEVADSGTVPAEGREVELVNNVTGEKFVSTVASGRVVFDGVPEGSYSIKVVSGTLAVGVITIGVSRLGLLASGGLVAGAAVGGGGAIAGGTEIVNRITDGDGPGAEESPVPTETPTVRPTIPPSAATPSPTPTVCDCEPDAEPTPLSPFR